MVLINSVDKESEDNLVKLKSRSNTILNIGPSDIDAKPSIYVPYVTTVSPPYDDAASIP
ncbi:hypothetical protein RYX36_010311 [Vicia faba]